VSRAVPAALFVLAAFAAVALVTHDDPERVVRATPATTTSSAPVPSSAPTTTTTEPEVVRSEPIEVNRTDPVVQPAPPVQVVQPQPAPAPAPAAQTCGDGYVIPGTIVWNESRCDPNAINQSSGAFGLYQILPMHWAPGGVCDDLAATRSNVQSQNECAWRLSKGGTNLKPWGA
jgi:hypothetical protein